MLVAHVRENVFDTENGQHLLAPRGARPIGLYDRQMAYGGAGTDAAGAAGFDAR